MQFVADFELVPHEADFLAILAKVAQQQLDRQPLAVVVHHLPDLAGLARPQLVEQSIAADILLGMCDTAA